MRRRGESEEECQHLVCAREGINERGQAEYVCLMCKRKVAWRNVRGIVE